MENEIVEGQTTSLVDQGKDFESGRLNPWNDFIITKSRNGKMMPFDVYRTSLGGADNGWGTHVFYKTMMDIGFIEKCEEKHKTESQYCPTEKAIEKYPEFFYYDRNKDIWGLNNNNLIGSVGFDEKILPTLASEAVKVREQWKEEKKRRASAKRYGKKQITNTLF